MPKSLKCITYVKGIEKNLLRIKPTYSGSNTYLITSKNQ